MKTIFLFLVGCLLLSHFAMGQNYSCISSLDSKTYFANANYNLTGLRIDSSKSINGNTVYYPFKSMRCSADLGSAFANVDSFGPSWLGAEITETSDYNTYIPTKWNDTFLIKNEAALGDSWIAYDDTSDIYFVGTVTAMDTMTIANTLDSVKTISISVMQGNNVLPLDSINGIQFAISKFHGLVKALPFYFFPFYNHHTDALNFYYDYYLAKYGAAYNVKNGLTFNRINYQPFSGEQIYNFNVGDVRISKVLTDAYYGFYRTEIDTLISKQITGQSIHYTSHYFTQSVGANASHNGLVYYTDSGSRDLYYSLEPIEDTSKMPEEIGNRFVEHYDANDNYMCKVSAAYNYDRVNLSPEATYDGTGYKNGRGCVNRYYNSFPMMITEKNSLIGYIENGHLCGETGLVGIANILEPSQLKIYPNPATDYIKIEIPEMATNKHLQVSLLNVLGVAVGHWNMVKNVLVIPTRGLSYGIYFVKISDGTGSMVRKVSIGN